MSTGVSNQRMKGHGNQANGPKDHVGEQEDLESWRNSQQMQQGYATAPVPSDPYMPNYYNTTFTTGYPPYGVSEGSWSNGSDAMGFLGGYTTTGEMAPASYIEGGVFSGNGNGASYSATSANYNSFPNAAAAATAFNYFHGNGDYSTWGSNQSMARKAQYEDYYREGMYSAPNATIKGLEHGMQAMGLEHKSEKDLKEPKKMSWASVAGQPAKPQPMLLSTGMKKKGPGMPPPPMVPGKHLDIGTWESRNGGVVKPPVAPPPVAVAVAVPAMPTAVVRPVWAGPPGPPVMHHPPPPQPLPLPLPPTVLPVLPPPPTPAEAPVNHQVLDELRVKNNYNPPEFDVNCKNARFFVIKSYSEDDIHRSIKYEIWCSTEHGNKRLDQAFRENENGPIYLFFSVNGSGHFCGMAQMVTPVDYHASSSVWAQDKWKGQFRVRWVYVKDVPNGQLRHIRLENNENKPVTNSRDTQEVPVEKGRQVLRVIHSYRHTTSIFDDFFHYEKRQEEEDHKRVPDEREAPSFHKERNEGDRDGRERDVRDRDTRESRDDREHREQRDSRDHREPRDSHDHRDERDNREHRDQRETRPHRDDRDTRITREQRDTREHREERDRRDHREHRDTRPYRDDRDRREHREQVDTREHRAPRDPRDQHRSQRGARNPNGAHRN